MKKWIINKKIQILSVAVLLIVMMPNLAAIRYAVFTPDDFKFAVGTNSVGNRISMLFGRFINPMLGLNYGLLRVALAAMFCLFVFCFFLFVYLFVVNLGVDADEGIIFSSIVVGSFLFFKENYELFFWWTGAVFYELPITLILCCLCLYLKGKSKNNIKLEVVAIALIVVIFIANFNIGTLYWIKENKDEDVNFIKAVYYSLCVVETEMKNYVKNTGVLLALGVFFIAGLKQKNTLILMKNIKKKIWWLILPFICAYPIVFCRNVYNIERMPNRGIAFVDIFLVLYLALVVYWVGMYVRSKTIKVDNTFLKMTYVFIALCAVVFVVNFRNASDVVICKNLITKQLQNYSDTWSSIYYICDTTNDVDLVIETSVMDRVEGCCYPKLRSNTSSEKNQAVATFFGLNTISLNNTYEE